MLSIQLYSYYYFQHLASLKVSPSRILSRAVAFIIHAWKWFSTHDKREAWTIDTDKLNVRITVKINRVNRQTNLYSWHTIFFKIESPAERRKRENLLKQLDHGFYASMDDRISHLYYLNKLKANVVNNILKQNNLGKDALKKRTFFTTNVATNPYQLSL